MMGLGDRRLPTRCATRKVRCRVRRVWAIAGAMVLTSSVCYGQDVTPEIGKGAKAFLFTFNGLSVIAAGNFDGGAGFKYYFWDGTAIRGAALFSNAHTKIAANPVAPATGTDGSVSA